MRKIEVYEKDGFVIFDNSKHPVWFEENNKKYALKLINKIKVREDQYDEYYEIIGYPYQLQLDTVDGNWYIGEYELWIEEIEQKREGVNQCLN